MKTRNEIGRLDWNRFEKSENRNRAPFVLIARMKMRLRYHSLIGLAILYMSNTH